ncbi:2Fe-2S iron-sulfur cluster-binding protein [Salmonirosea aquatica]|uniref:2Fe-2S iron-sulfur cluster binding domain-containing protein n=1 Tax=Salmonirosea aquatica TaxID=2654236 RepID=A0A7C9BFZ7_9BACT|nr:2Fe-2S iron-sulfur cluster binding domain-containing protein [Cytophagaceae bacterium SJW1-29]
MQENVLSLRIRNIISETSDTRTFVLELAEGGALSYEPGQFLTFLLHVQGHEVRRSYSMSSTPGVDEFPAVTIKRVTNGEISRYWHDHVEVGTRLTALPPAGRFVLEPAEGQPRDVVLIGAGSGITPLFSILKYVLTNEPESRVTLLYASRRERSIIFGRQLAEWQRGYPDRLEIVHVLSQPTDDWLGTRGRINNFRLERMIGRYLHFPAERARFFLCGPFELMRTTEITLRFMGFEDDQIRKENFVIDPAPPPPKHSEPHTIQLTFRSKTYALEVPAYTTILQAGLEQGIPIPYSCRGGRCATCAALCRSGTVRMSINDVLTDRDLAQGWVLTCTAYVESEGVVVEVV